MNNIIVGNAASELVTLALNEMAETVVVPCLKDTTDEMLKAFDNWCAASDIEDTDLLAPFQDGAFGGAHPEENADDKDVKAAFKAGRIWRLAKDAEVHRALDIRAVAMLELLKK